MSDKEVSAAESMVVERDTGKINIESMAIASLSRDVVSRVVLESMGRGVLEAALAGLVRAEEGFVADEAVGYGCSARVICAT
jgi:hypothetical protein